MYTMIIPAWRENLRAKLEDLSRLDRQTGPLQVIIVSDVVLDTPIDFFSLGITIHWIVELERTGKPAAINRAMQEVTTPIVIFHDSNTELSSRAIVELCRPFSDPSVGGVAGEKRVRAVRSDAPALEGFYWRYESAWKKIDASFHSVIGGAGELFAMRSELFRPLSEDCLLDDLELSWQVIEGGYRIEYAPKAVSTEAPSASLQQEAKRKIRIAAGAYQFLSRHSLYSIFRRSARYGLQFFFRKWIRWVAWPLLTVLLPWVYLLARIYFPDHLLVNALGWSLLGISGVALIGGALAGLGIRIGWFGLPFYFLFVQYCQIRGWWRYHFGNPTVLWEKSDRSAILKG